MPPARLGPSYVMRPPRARSRGRRARPAGHDRARRRPRSIRARRAAGERRGELGAGAVVETGEGLVEDDGARPASERAGEHDAARLARRSARRPDAVRTRGVEPDVGERARHEPPATRARRGAVTSAMTVGRSSCSRACWNVMPTVPNDAAAAAGLDVRVALARLEQPGEDPRERRLARPVVPDDEQGLARGRCGGRRRRARGAPTACARVHVPDAAEDEQRAARAPLNRGSSLRRGDGDGRYRDHAAAIVIIRSAAAASAARWVMCTTAISSSVTSERNNETSWARPAPSTIAVDSSEMSSCGRRASAAATASRCSSPPDNVEVSRSANARRPTRSSNAPTSTADGSVRPHPTSSRTRTPSTWSSGRWNTIAVPPIAPRPTRPGRAHRAASVRRPARMRASVDFPEPFGPTIATISPARISSETSCSTSASPPG